MVQFLSASGRFETLRNRLIPQRKTTSTRSGRLLEIVRAWLEHPPGCQLQPDPVSDPALDETLDPDERAAITLELSTSADRLFD
jgi:hypothetical protein